MRRIQNIPATASRFLAACLSAALLLPGAAQAVDLANAPLTASTASAVNPNLLFVLDDSGSMSWTFMPDAVGVGYGDNVAQDFLGTTASPKYGYKSSQCNTIYYDPGITYQPPARADGTAYANAVFTASKLDGFDTANNPASVDLNSGFIPNRFVPDSQNANYNSTSYKSYAATNYNYAGSGAYYYLYSGAQTKKNYFNTALDFYRECSSVVGIAPGNGVFAKRRLASTMSTTIMVFATVSTAYNATINNITVGDVELISAPVTGTVANLPTLIRNAINARTATTGFSVTPLTGTISVITLTGPASAANQVPKINSINATESPYPASVAATYRGMTAWKTDITNATVMADIFPESTDPARLTNFANWHSYYRTRMLMMKSAAGIAFQPIGSNFRVGFMTINNNSMDPRPTIPNATFNATQKTQWYNAFYAASPTGSTPLLRALSNAGRYYAGKLPGTTDPVQYSCQQNFTLLSTDGFWNVTSDRPPLRVDGTAFPWNDNQDGVESATLRPMWDGAASGANINYAFTYNRWITVCTGACPGGNRIRFDFQEGSCTGTTANGCNPGAWTTLASDTSPGANCYGNPCGEVQNLAIASIKPAGGGSVTNRSLADVAMYYYKTDLRASALNLNNCKSATGETLCGKDNVFTSSLDTNNKQHMATFTLNLGAPGKMSYVPCYMSNTCSDNEDFNAVKSGAKADSTATPPICPWQTNGTVCNWPLPGDNDSSGANIDDLWHAAVNGHGQYFSATNPTTLVNGISTALASINSRRGAGAGAAVSSLAPVAGNNYAYLPSYTSVSWTGNLMAITIDPDTGEPNVDDIRWCVEDTGGCTGTMKKLGDTRTLYVPKTDGPTPALTAFDAAWAVEHPSYFPTSFSGLTQWNGVNGDGLTTAQKANVTIANLAGYLRGQSQFEQRDANPAANRVFRAREAVLGDIVESAPVFLAEPVFFYEYKGYAAFKSEYASRPGTIYVGANDGMLHAFDAANGKERWAYIPGMVLPNLWKLADSAYGANHINFVNGTPVTSDVCVSNCDNDHAVWKTILVAGLGGGGRGYYALDITDVGMPDGGAPKLLWELTPSSGGGTVTDDDIGYGFGSAVITRKTNGAWVVLVASGYNNTDPGDGKGYLYVLNPQTGQIINKMAAQNADGGSSGLAHITTWNADPLGAMPGYGNTAGYTYGGDLLGNVWRFDINAEATSGTFADDVMKFAALKDPAGKPQPITTTPVLGLSKDKRIIFVATGKFLEAADFNDKQVQSLYAMKDDDNTETLNPREASNFAQRTIQNNADGETRIIETSGSQCNVASKSGWFVDFPDSGERANIDGKLILGTLLIPTNVPITSSGDVCSVGGGYGWLNFFDYETGCPVTLLVSSRYDSQITGLTVIYTPDDGPGSGVLVSDEKNRFRRDPKVPPLKKNPGDFTGTRVMWRAL